MKGLRAHDEAEREPRVRLDHVAGVVAAVMTLADDAIVPFDSLPKRMFSAGEYQTHDGLGVEVFRA